MLGLLHTTPMSLSSESDPWRPDVVSARLFAVDSLEELVVAFASPRLDRLSSFRFDRTRSMSKIVSARSNSLDRSTQFYFARLDLRSDRLIVGSIQ